MSVKADDKEVRAARRLCELFRGRFSEEVAQKLIDDLGGELEAVDFILNEKESVVSEYLKKNPDYVQDMREDSKKISSLLENGIEYEIRQFACEPCTRSWWKKVPVRKEVGKCKRCHVKYDPVPQEKEWGWAKFVCVCSNEFHAYGEMGVTYSDCYKCGASVPIERVLPPRRRIGTRKKSNKPHSCNGTNCFNFSQHDDYIGAAMGGVGGGGAHMTSYKSHHASHHNNITYNMSGGAPPPQQGQGSTGACQQGEGQGNQAQAAGAYPPSSRREATPVCIHPKSNQSGRRIRTPSKKHVSTGSTVKTFLTQGSLDTATVSVAFSLPLDRIKEVKEVY